MADFKFISARGETMPLAHNKYFTLAYIDAHTYAEADVSAVTASGADGDTINSMQTPARILVIDLRINSDVEVEDAKRYILKYVNYRKRCGVRWTQNGREVDIYGKVERVDLPRWEQGVTMQISLHCEQPFWEDVADVVQQISEAISLHYFTSDPADMLYFPEEGIAFGEYDTIRTKTFFNEGDVAVPLEITILAHDTVTNPIIYDQNGNFFGLGYEATHTTGNTSSAVYNPFIMQAGDNVVITTHRGNKTVKYNGVEIFDKIKPNSTWLQLDAGANTFSINSDDDSITNMSFSLIYKQRYI